jgi:leucyl aminopeptidase
MRLPLDSLTIPVIARTARVSAAALARYPAAILVLPPTPADGDFRSLAHADVIRAAHAAKPRRAGDVLTTRVGERAQTLMVLAYAGAKSSTFELLQLAQKTARAALEFEPVTLLLQHSIEDGGLKDAAILAIIAGLQAAAFRLASFKSKPKRTKQLARIDIAGSTRIKDLELTLATSGGNNLARWLTALPPNELDARNYRRHLQEFATRHRLAYKFYGERELKRLGAGAFLAVSQGNQTRDAGIARLSYRPRGGSAAAVSLIGKGICFDTGGTNLKSHKGMLDMHIDMEGSAVALGSLHAMAQLKSKTPVDCWLAITENRTGPAAYKPQDIVRTLNGTTIQVIHTDAEGRMVLADTLALAARRKPRAMIDYATLTGACLHALTERYSGAFTNRLETRAQIELAGAQSGERVWCFPMDADFDSDLDSTVADVMQCAVEGKGDHILASRFLNRFVPKEIPWLHIDLSAGMRHGGLAHIGTDITGFGVRYTLELLRSGWPNSK